MSGKLPLLAALALLWTAPLAATRESEAPGYLRQAAFEFRRGAPERSRFYYNIALGLDRSALQADPYARRLDTLLYFAERNDRVAIARIVEGHVSGADPFLLYMMARLELERAPLPVARRAYLQVASQTTIASADRDAAPISLVALSPLACPPESPELADRWLTYSAQGPFDDPLEYGALLERQLDPFELAQAAAAALFLTPDDARHRPQRKSAREALLRARQQMLPAPQAELQMPLLHLLAHVDEDEAHRLCLRNLDRLAATLRQRIQTGNVEPSSSLLRHLRQRSDLMHQMRSIFFNTPAAAFAYGMHLLNTERPLPALHNFRISLLRSMSQLRASSASGIDWQDASTLAQMHQSLRQLELSYQRLGRAADARTSGALARIIESRLAEPDKAVAELEIDFLQRAGENLLNREALLFLRRGANGERRQQLELKLRQRDQRLDLSELLSAYDYAGLRP
ncbi:MAG: hypothetical protein K1X75_12860 [Leptospirales bacterium]|nr:hypothetical protein [Leptospirales bacterium]